MEKKSLAALSFLFLVLFAAYAKETVAIEDRPSNCAHLSNTYRGPCVGFLGASAVCNVVCIDESQSYRSGDCYDWQCWCWEKGCQVDQKNGLLSILEHQDA
ncbi:hypothetical protein TSUD_144750 [Trifolium subterraneum]|uniref:Knottin scorpion toxin-like domain-containing protein n=1 Tax=Trifolium subterraneum TaxID=3900 RepID=A0A2Z6ML03_TRISU|nr:hypothetical protein TSUD_144750 [Trifolium subterraneum]